MTPRSAMLTTAAVIAALLTTGAGQAPSAEVTSQAFGMSVEDVNRHTRTRH